MLFNTQQFPAISWREQVNFQWDDDEVCSTLLKFIPIIRWYEIKDVSLRAKTIGFQPPLKLSGRSLAKLHIILEMKSGIATLSKVKNLLFFGRKTNKERGKKRKIDKLLMMSYMPRTSELQRGFVPLNPLTGFYPGLNGAFDGPRHLVQFYTFRSSLP